MTDGEYLTNLDALWSTWAEYGRTMTDEQWALPTRLEAWDVRSLYAHVASWPAAFPALLAQVRDTEPTHATAAALLRAFNGPDGVATRMRDWSAAKSRDDAAKYTVEQLVDQFADTGAKAIAAARELGPVAVDYYGQAVLGVGEAARIGIMEATVHLLDLQRALGAEPDVPAAALTTCATLLAQVADPIAFVEAATGRSTDSPLPVIR